MRRRSQSWLLGFAVLKGSGISRSTIRLHNLSDLSILSEMSFIIEIV